MQKQKLRSLRKACQTSNIASVTTTTIFKSMLLLAVCFCYFKPNAVAQKYNFDQRILMNMMENRKPGLTQWNQKVSDHPQLISVLIPATVTTIGLIENDRATLKKGLYLAESALASTFVTYAMKYSFKRSRP